MQGSAVARYPELYPRNYLIMSKHKMTDRWVQSFASAPGRRAEVGDLLCPGLYLRCSARGAKSWSLLVRVQGKVRRVTLGRYPVLGLAAAREDALRLMREAAAGVGIGAPDPVPGRTLGEVLEAYVEHIAKNARSWKLIASNLRRPEMADLRAREVGAVAKRELVEVIDSIAADGTPHAASSLLRHLKMAFNYAVERDMMPVNPLDKVRPPVRTTQRDRVLTDVELASVWHAAGNLPQPWTAMYRMLMLTGQRRSEVSNMRWEEVSHDTWIIPRERVKKDRPHMVPLTLAARTLLDSLPMPASGKGFVFSTDGGKSASSNFHKSKAKLDDTSGVEEWVIHDIRRTVRSGLAALGVSRDVARAVVNHADGKVDAIYNRYDYATEKREALGKWARHLEALVKT